MVPKRIAIVGGGFGGVKCAKTLRKKLPPDDYQIVIYNRENHMVFHPLLAEVVGASINPDVTGTPLRQMLRGIHCRTADIQRVDLDERWLEYEGADGRVLKKEYEHIVLASGLGPNLNVVPGMADHAFPLKTVGDALHLRTHVLQQLELAELADDEEQRRQRLSFIVVGGGYSGVEVAGEINDLVLCSLRYFQKLSRDDLSVSLVHSRGQILPELSPDLRNDAQERMERRGIRMLLNERVTSVTAAGVVLSSGTEIVGATTVCTVGNTVLPFMNRLNVAKERGRLLTEPDMRVKGYDYAWALGDCAVVVNTYDNEVSPPTGQFAERQGYQTALNIVRSLKGEPTRPFYFRQLGQMCAIGGRRGVGKILGVKVRGFPAWFIWRTIYLMKLPSLSRRVKVALDWTWELFFSRDLAHLKTDLTERISTAHFDEGDAIFCCGDPACDLYVIKSGEVEVLQPNEQADDEVLAVLGPGDFFGEMALVDEKPHRRTCRARTEVETVVIGKKVFERMAASMGPMQEFLANAIRRRTDIWQFFPRAAEILRAEPLSTFVEPPRTHLSADLPYESALERFMAKKETFFFVLDENDHLVGVVTRTDLLRVLETAVEGDRRSEAVYVRDIMVPHPVFVTAKDTTATAVATMRDQGLKKLPVVADEHDQRLVGYLRIEQIMDFVMQRIRKDEEKSTALESS